MCAHSNADGAAPVALPKVLVIDDERGPRESLRILLKPEYQVLCAESVDDGIALLKEHQPDTVVMDIRMPGKNGIEGLKAIREIDGVVSIIMFTGFGALETAQEAIRLGANEYIKKPFDAFEIREIIRNRVGRTQQERRRQHVETDLGRMNEDLKNELVRNERLATLGQKSAELVHDLRNPLTSIMGYLGLLSEWVKNPAGAPGQNPENPSDYIGIIEENAMLCKNLSEMWLNVSRGSLHRTPVKLGSLLQFVLKDSRVVAGEHEVTVSADIGTPEPVIEADQVQLTRAIQNLATNAIHAVYSKKGWVRIVCRETGSGVEIAVEDNGHGMDEDQIRKVCEPFYTTKNKHGGTGLGMFIARQVAEAHGGTLRITSQPGQGTQITISIPHQPG
ncbi:MAG: hybrid sensor histidine kinase/response regulator [bacterium]